jgi:hypothetical protein
MGAENQAEKVIEHLEAREKAIHRVLFLQNRRRAVTACGLQVRTYFKKNETARLVNGHLIGCSHDQSKVRGCEICEKAPK